MSIFEVDIIRPKYSDHVTVIPPLGGGPPFDPNPTFVTVTATDRVTTNLIESGVGPVTLYPVDGRVAINDAATVLREEATLGDAKLILTGKSSLRPEYNAGGDYSWTLDPNSGPITIDHGLCFSEYGEYGFRGIGWPTGAQVDTNVDAFTIKFKMNIRVAGGALSDVMTIFLLAGPFGIGILYNDHISWSAFFDSAPIAEDITVTSLSENFTHELLFQFTHLGPNFIVKACVDGVQSYRQTIVYPDAGRRQISNILRINHDTSGVGVGDVQISDLQVFDYNLLNPNDNIGYVLGDPVGIARTMLPAFEVVDTAGFSHGLVRQDAATGLTLSSGDGRVTVNHPLYFQVNQAAPSVGLDAYEVFSKTVDLNAGYNTGVDGPAAFSYTVVRIGKLVTLSWKGVNESHIGSPDLVVSANNAIWCYLGDELTFMLPPWGSCGPIWVWHSSRVLSTITLDTDNYITINSAPGVEDWVQGDILSFAGGTLHWVLA